jgi:uncharacterized membrane protein
MVLFYFYNVDEWVCGHGVIGSIEGVVALGAISVIIIVIIITIFIVMAIGHCDWRKNPRKPQHGSAV